MGRGKAEDLRVEGFEDFASLDLTDERSEFERERLAGMRNAYQAPGTGKRRNGRISWKAVAAQAQYEAKIMGILAVCMSVLGGVIGFIAGVNFQ